MDGDLADLLQSHTPFPTHDCLNAVTPVGLCTRREPSHGCAVGVARPARAVGFTFLRGHGEG